MGGMAEVLFDQNALPGYHRHLQLLDVKVCDDHALLAFTLARPDAWRAVREGPAERRVVGRVGERGWVRLVGGARVLCYTVMDEAGRPSRVEKAELSGNGKGLARAPVVLREENDTRFYLSLGGPTSFKEGSWRSARERVPWMCP